MEYTVKFGQTLSDVALMTAGTIEAVMAIAAYNDIALTDELTAGQTIYIPATMATNTEMQTLYRRDKIV
ncbi:MAG: LysM peptidoglycan-binding domain-containing protein, partial [Chitinophagia bacterium]|nr:LysM peptidoglycan-binding domain-containing protein [Chitinophagia bacterium]